MTNYTSDGGVIPSGMPTSARDTNGHYKLFGVYRGMVTRAIYPDEKENVRKDRMEYVVRIRGQDYPNCIDATEGGGIYNYQLRIRKEVTESSDSKIDKGTFREKLNGEAVFVMFIEGNGDTPIIFTSDTHPRHAPYKKPVKADGLFDIEEFNGLEISVDKDSNYLIKQVGRKDDKGVVQNTDAVGSLIKLFGANGDIEINAYDSSATDCRIKFTKADKKIEINANNNKVVMDSVGILLEDKNANKVTMNSSGIKLEDSNGNKVTMSATGIELEDSNGNKITMSATSININSTAQKVLIDGSEYGKHQHVGNLGVPTPPPLDANIA